MKKGEKVGAVKIRNAFDKYAIRVLSEYFEEVDTARGKRSQYKIVKDLPTKEEYNKLRNTHFTTNPSDLISDGFSEIESLAGEMRDWYDGMPESFQNADKGTAVGEAADTLENVSTPDLPQILEHIQVVRFPDLDANSRAARAADACDMIRVAVEAINEWIGENRENDESTKTIEVGQGDEKESIEVNFDDLETLIQECESAADEVEGVEFPGMYG